jgi:hypothetical protein
MCKRCATGLGVEERGGIAQREPWLNQAAGRDLTISPTHHVVLQGSTSLH